LGFLWYQSTQWGEGSVRLQAEKGKDEDGDDTNVILVGGGDGDRYLSYDMIGNG